MNFFDCPYGKYKDNKEYDKFLCRHKNRKSDLCFLDKHPAGTDIECKLYVKEVK